MKNKIDILEEKITKLKNIFGEIDTNNLNIKPGNRLTLSKDKFRTVSDVIAILQKEISDNDSITFKDVYKKFEELLPLLDIEKLKLDCNLSEKEMYLLIISNFDDLKSFYNNFSYVKENQHYLEVIPIVDSNEKVKQIKPLELKTLDLNTKTIQISNNIDELLKTYNETCDIINKKFAMYNKLLTNIEKN